MIILTLLLFTGLSIDSSMGINLFNDFKKGTFGYECDVKSDDDILTNDAPDKFDWRSSGAVTGVKNQGDCDAGWAFALIGAIEGQYIQKHGNKVQFSEQELIDCLDDCGCDVCSSSSAITSLIDLGGVQLQSDYPYSNKNSKQECSYKPVLSKTKINKCFNYELDEEKTLKEVLYKNGPLFIAVNGTPLKKYVRGVLKECPNGDLNHAVLLVGYGSEDGDDYWVIKNSWGADWGENGFARISRGINACGLMNSGTASITIK